MSRGTQKVISTPCVSIIKIGILWSAEWLKRHRTLANTRTLLHRASIAGFMAMVISRWPATLHTRTDGGALAAGGSLAIDDAYAFAAALWYVFPPASAPYSKAKVQLTLSLFERTGKPHTDRVMALVREGNDKTIARLRQSKKETDEELSSRIQNRLDPFWITSMM